MAEPFIYKGSEFEVELYGGSYAITKGTSLTEKGYIIVPPTYNGTPIAYINTGAFTASNADSVFIHKGIKEVSTAFIDSGVSMIGIENGAPTWTSGWNDNKDPYDEGYGQIPYLKYTETLCQDWDFLGFTFAGKHCYLDLGVMRTINDRFQHSVQPESTQLTADSPGGDGTYYFGSRHKLRKFTVSFAFDHLTEEQLREWKKFCSNKELSDLIFDEEPYKVYTAKITGNSSLKSIPFEENDERIYKGEGTLEFTCYWPYAHTPDENTKVSKKFLADGRFQVNGKALSSYPEPLYPTKNQWAPASGIEAYTPGDNFGDMPAPFVYSTTTTLNANDTITVGDLTIEVLQTTHNLKWDSKTGIVSGTDASGDETTRKPIPYSGNSLGGIPVGGTSNIPTNGTLTYHYWYY